MSRDKPMGKKKSNYKFYNNVDQDKKYLKQASNKIGLDITYIINLDP